MKELKNFVYNAVTEALNEPQKLQCWIDCIEENGEVATAEAITELIIEDINYLIQEIAEDKKSSKLLKAITKRRQNVFFDREFTVELQINLGDNFILGIKTRQDHCSWDPPVLILYAGENQEQKLEFGFILFCSPKRREEEVRFAVISETSEPEKSDY